ncbi:hypothetical protein [Flavisolibacter tropicus]|uniref:TonB-dependent receptor plug domain-containing protein n=1 Tax=Flavisolibacter tropicus TaxID=1492898 RepID=A0A172TZM7_9BACT|nr:hypothetical protein [Flavisolibacter tropicus]ANE52545.1 hypothetical protein SY85_20755 [Flavisolibacter tropicus]
MRIGVLTLLFVLLYTQVVAQSDKEATQTDSILIINGDRLIPFMDSLKQAIYTDTIKFNRSNLVHTTNNTRNKEPYSSLYIVNGQYQYKLDIIESYQVAEFVNAVLNSSKVKSITVIEKAKVDKNYFPHIQQNAIFITFYHQAKFNPKIAGLKRSRKNGGDNFNQRKKGEPMVLQ